MITFPLEVLTPDGVVFSDQVNEVTVPGTRGILGILAKHAPLYAKLTHGELTIKKEGAEPSFISIGSGFIEVNPPKVKILVTRALKEEELIEQEILNAKARAEKILEEKPTGETLIQARLLLKQSLTDLSILRKRKKFSKNY
ncbi:ATP synthase F1 subunit epsilon [Candidatus Woesebacteria bacterium RIFCSPHIGHO2_02_FULL_38_9]|uniref:ATP synthase epsilon chain n=1 Tax=Candidatus Woesebacteria bacterium RIFCSPHIGHO2_01_FULL_39_28 TaxID=1802496 RepID=A0A1F7YCG4_9BACT|nr:MAG: ATP synthase F1 subunit epsilon [Candidatus Woesebacteria bacterium RIFCSPHIGHO2_01_FULL_39_28]OGM33948.1 MAG: ATP synthase F1 subunit epsilon [Candidatus Woesebacteria bacterium RIFCSPHIGHO2_02_FULL_38_9]OGM57547.1 MAG: ATP synthase F1 subunit epsilon [Candidatus Woesebacteria bacterium RIFCSPLOWO2_01_FULL_38_20]